LSTNDYIRVPYPKFKALREAKGAAFLSTKTATAISLYGEIGGQLVSARIDVADTSDWLDFEATMEARANTPILARLGRKKTPDLAKASTWHGESLPVGHPHKPPTAFVALDDAGKVAAVGEWIAIEGEPRGRMKALDQVALPYDAEDPGTYWVPFPTFRLIAPAGMQVIIARARVTTNHLAQLPEGASANFQLWTTYNPVTGQRAAPGSTPGVPWYNYVASRPAQDGDDPGHLIDAPCPLVAPPVGLWLYDGVDDLVDFADHIDMRSSDVLPGETGFGPRMSAVFDYQFDAGDSHVDEAVIDGRYGEFMELTITNHEPVTSCGRCVVNFKILTRDVF
jgi:hypothetical protein